MEIPIPNDWDGISFCRWAICWPESVLWEAILRGLVTNPSRGRFWDADTGNILEVQEAFLPALDYNSQLKEVFMACDDQGLTLIAQAINNLALSVGGSGKLSR
jgi:hypothetical protein